MASRMVDLKCFAAVGVSDAPTFVSSCVVR